MIIGQNYVDFKAETDVSVPYLHTLGTRERLLIPESRLISIDAHKMAFDLVLSDYIDPAKHKDSVVIDLKRQYTIFRLEMTGLKKQLKAHLDVTLLGADYASLFIHKNIARRRKVPAPVIAPHNSVLQQNASVVQIFTNNPTPSHETERTRPTDVAKIGRKIALTALGSPEPAADTYITLDASGKVTYKLKFPATDYGKEAWLITWYISPSGESGPQSRPLKFIIT